MGWVSSSDTSVDQCNPISVYIQQIHLFVQKVSGITRIMQHHNEVSPELILTYITDDSFKPWKLIQGEYPIIRTDKIVPRKRFYFRSFAHHSTSGV